jgi:hypothetical protein
VTHQFRPLFERQRAVPRSVAEDVVGHGKLLRKVRRAPRPVAASSVGRSASDMKILALVPARHAFARGARGTRSAARSSNRESPSDSARRRSSAMRDPATLAHVHVQP